jgi:hypothetical protein
MYTSVQKNGDFLRIMIDPAIYEEVEGSDLFRILSDINDENLAYSEAVKAYRPTWMDELHDLDVALNGKDENRNINFRVFRHFVIYDTGIKTALNVEWSIEGEPTEEIYPPTWDQARETQRIRAELLAEQAKAPVLSRKLPDSKQLTSKKPNSGIDISKKNTSKDQEKVTKPIQGSSNVIPVLKTTPNPDQGTSI